MTKPEDGDDHDDDDPVLHVLLVGFHHKKGCQVEYAYPPLPTATTAKDDDEGWWPELPAQWKHIPSLALPDGSHHYVSDTSFFHLPALDNPRKTIFGISCYRQIEADMAKIKVKDGDSVTRTTVQKAVCVLSSLPLYGHIQVKMSLITEAFFREADFTRLDLIHETYSNLNSCLGDEMLRTQQLYVGLSARDFIRKFRQRALVLFKLTLLERKVLLFRSPVSELAAFLLTLLSLHPGMLERGLGEAARMVPADTPSPCTSPIFGQTLEQDGQDKNAQEDEQQHKEEGGDDEDKNEDDLSSVISSNSIVDSATEKVEKLKGKLSGAIGYYMTGTGVEEALEAKEDGEELSTSDEESTAAAAKKNPDFHTVAALDPETDLNLPLNVFTAGNLCHPYLSLSQLDSLSQPSVRGYLIGATNVLFKQKKGVSEVLVEICEDKLDIHDAELKQALNLTTEDLRFMDSICGRVCGDKIEEEKFFDGVGWEGGDEWVRAQFRFYLTCLLRSSLDLGKATQCQEFNPTFVRLWTRTQNYRHWRRKLNEDVLRQKLPFGGHPSANGTNFSGVNDVKLHLSNTISNSESGKRVSQVVSNTGKAVAGGFNSAKGAVSSFFTSFRSNPNQQQQDPPAEKEEDGEKIEAWTKDTHKKLDPVLFVFFIHDRIWSQH